MADWLKEYGTCEGPLGVPMRDAQARAVEALLKTLPAEDRVLKHVVKAQPESVGDGAERSDVSWITTEEADLDREIVISRGMNNSAFAANPMVTLQHCYWAPPVGKSLWQKKSRASSGQMGVKAKTVYPPRPDELPEALDWQPDETFALVKSGLMNGKSIGFIALKKHVPSSHEIAGDPTGKMGQVRCIIDEWLLLEYACTFAPCNMEALVEQVGKSRAGSEMAKALGLTIPAPIPVVTPPVALPPSSPITIETIPYTTWEEVENIIKSRIGGIDWNRIMAVAAQDAIERAAGRV